MSASRVHRPTETAAIGRVGRPPTLNLQHLLWERGAARTKRDMHGVHILQGRISRALDPQAGE